MWATPRTSDVNSGRTLNEKGQRTSKSSDLVFGANLADQVKMWPTPLVQEAKHGQVTQWEMETDHAATKDSLRVAVAMWPTPTANEDAAPEEWKRGSLNPNWVEWLMGYPDGWTSLETSQE
tara:strand:- start:159 stop:521 length:363 start_codon:yes stop_codon:yes gene_type:complete